MNIAYLSAETSNSSVNLQFGSNNLIGCFFYTLFSSSDLFNKRSTILKRLPTRTIFQPDFQHLEQRVQMLWLELRHHELLPRMHGIQPQQLELRLLQLVQRSQLELQHLQLFQQLAKLIELRAKYTYGHATNQRRTFGKTLSSREVGEITHFCFDGRTLLLLRDRESFLSIVQHCESFIDGLFITLKLTRADKRKDLKTDVFQRVWETKKNMIPVAQLRTVLDFKRSRFGQLPCGVCLCAA